MKIGDAYPRVCEIWANEELDLRVKVHGIVVFVGCQPDGSVAWDVQINTVELYQGPLKIAPLAANYITDKLKTRIELALIGN